MLKDQYISLDDDRLCCPICGFSGGFHQSKYRISNPEDHGQKSVIVDATTLKGTESTGFKLDDSRPREAIEIKFWCENCGANELRLQIIQHKGSTHMKWGY